jgi:tRNA wybutosine-synthesizing protein 1
MDVILQEQQRILSGYGGAKTTDMARLEEARRPKHVAISLMGEPTFYPHLRELIEEIGRRDMTSFLVTNGTKPDALKDVRPTQLYLSLNAPNSVLYERICNPRGDRDLWGKIQESLEIVRDHPSRTVVRMTLARGMNMNVQDIEGFARLLERAEPDFVEVKAYMHLGRSRERLDRDSMPSHSEIMEFARLLGESLGYNLAGEVPLSRVALLSRGRIPASIGHHASSL